MELLTTKFGSSNQRCYEWQSTWWAQLNRRNKRNASTERPTPPLIEEEAPFLKHVRA
jgi:hypothetical protein